MDELRETFDELVTRQARTFRYDQAVERGVSRHHITHEVAARRAQRLLPGVYLQHTGTPTALERRHATLLYARDPHAALALWTAAEMHDLSCPRTPVVHALMEGRPPTAGGRRVRLHQTRDLRPEDVAEIDGLRVTTKVRTIVDLAQRLSEREVRYLLSHAVARRGVDVCALREHLDRNPHAPHTLVLRRWLDAAGDGAATGAELVLVDGLRRRGWTVEANAWIDLADGRKRQGDAVIESIRAVVQVESSAHHELYPDVESDVDRDVDWEEFDYLTVRTTTRRLERQLEAELDRICRELQRRADSVRAA